MEFYALQHDHGYCSSFLWNRVFRCEKFEQLQVCCKVDFVSLFAVEGNCLAVSSVIFNS